MATGICAGKLIAIVVGVGAAGFLGYNWVTTGCPTGVCPTERAAQATITPAAMTTTAAEQTDACCALTAETVAAAETCATEQAYDAEKACETACETACEGDVQVAAVGMITDEKAESCCSEQGATEPCDENKPCCIENFGLADKSAQP